MGKRHSGEFLYALQNVLRKMSRRKKKMLEQLSEDERRRYDVGRTRYVYLASRFIKKILSDRIPVYAAQAAYYVIMSAAPMLFLLLTFLKYTPLSEEMILETLSIILNEDLMDSVRAFLSGVYHGSFRFVSFAALSLFWVAGSGVMGLTKGLNCIHSVKENRNYLILRARSSFYAVLLVVAFIIALGSMVFGIRSISFLSRIFPFFNPDEYMSSVLVTLIALIVLTWVFNALYVLLPNRRVRFFSQIYGAIFTTIAWCVFSLIFSIYLALAKNLSILYGGLITIVMTLLWLYICMWLFFLGGEINAWMENSDGFPF